MICRIYQKCQSSINIYIIHFNNLIHPPCQYQYNNNPFQPMLVQEVLQQRYTIIMKASLEISQIILSLVYLHLWIGPSGMSGVKALKGIQNGSFRHRLYIYIYIYFFILFFFYITSKVCIIKFHGHSLLKEIKTVLHKCISLSFVS